MTNGTIGPELPFVHPIVFQISAIHCKCEKRRIRRQQFGKGRHLTKTQLNRLFS